MGTDPKVDLSSFDNSHYKPGSIIKRGLWYIISIIFIESALPFPYCLKILFLKIFGASAGQNITIKPKVKIKYPWFLKIGSNVWIGEGVWIDNLAFVHIKDNVCISQGAYLLTGNHNYKKTTFDLITKGIILEEGVWVGAKSVICPGIKLSNHSIISTGSVVCKDTEEYTIYRGNPAVPVGKRSLED